MKFLHTFALFASLVAILLAQEIDLHTYNLSDCARVFLAETGVTMTGVDYNVDRKWARCRIYAHNAVFIDWGCLCKEGDGEGSAIIDLTLAALYVIQDCGWDYSFGKCPWSDIFILVLVLVV